MKESFEQNLTGFKKGAFPKKGSSQNKFCTPKERQNKFCTPKARQN